MKPSKSVNSPRKLGKKTSKAKKNKIIKKNGSSRPTSFSSASSISYGAGIMAQTGRMNKLPKTARDFVSTVGTQKHELVLEQTDFVDYVGNNPSGPVMQYSFSMLQKIFGEFQTVPGNDTAVSKIESVTVHALPRAQNASVADTSILVLYGTQSLTKAPSADGTDGIADIVSQHNTLLNPTFNVRWMKVGSTDFDKVFHQSVLQPVRFKEAMQMFSIMCVNPDDGTPITTAVQLMITVRYRATLPVGTEMKAAITYGGGFNTLIDSSESLRDQLTMTKLVSLSETV